MKAASPIDRPRPMAHRLAQHLWRDPLLPYVKIASENHPFVIRFPLLPQLRSYIAFTLAALFGPKPQNGNAPQTSHFTRG